MKNKPAGCSRREFFKTAGAAGAGALMAPLAVNAYNADPKMERLTAAGQDRVPTRPFGKSGVDVSILSLGGMFDLSANQLMLRQAIRWGVTYWDTADCYQRGSESGIGKYFAKFPQDREKVFLVSKSDARDPDGMSQLLNRSLERMNTSYIDLYFVHGVRDIDELNEDTRRWAEKAKTEKKIRLFGFSTHRNMETLLSQAAGLGYIDGIMMSYNFRNMHTPEMKAGGGGLRQSRYRPDRHENPGRAFMDQPEGNRQGRGRINGLLYGKGAHRASGQAQGGLDQPEYRQHLLPDAQYDHLEGQCRGCHRPCAAFPAADGSLPEGCAGHRRPVLHRLRPYL